MREAGAGEGTDGEGGACVCVCEQEGWLLKLRNSYTVNSFVWAAPAKSLGRADCAKATQTEGRGGVWTLMGNQPASESIHWLLICFMSGGCVSMCCLFLREMRSHNLKERLSAKWEIRVHIWNFGWSWNHLVNNHLDHLWSSYEQQLYIICLTNKNAGFQQIKCHYFLCFSVLYQNICLCFGKLIFIFGRSLFLWLVFDYSIIKGEKDQSVTNLPSPTSCLMSCLSQIIRVEINTWFWEIQSITIW